jgi:hypothetical protein
MKVAIPFNTTYTPKKKRKGKQYHSGDEICFCGGITRELLLWDS